MIDLSVSLVSCNQKQDIERLLPSIITACSFLRSEILLVDNRSIDDTTGFVKGMYPSINIVENSAIAGYGENHNINLDRAKGRYFIIMNSDMIINSDVFLCLSDFMNEHDDIGIVSPKILNKDGTVQGLNKRYPTITDLFIRRFSPHYFSQIQIVRRRLDYYEMRDIGYDHIYDVPFLSGSFMFCRTDLLKKVGGFDPEYFLYFEDVDLCRRVQNTHRTVYNPSSSVIHFWKREAHKNCLFTYYFIRSAFRYFNRWGYKFL